MGRCGRDRSGAGPEAGVRLRKNKNNVQASVRMSCALFFEKKIEDKTKRRTLTCPSFWYEWRYRTFQKIPYEIEHIRPDYFLYPRFLGTAYGFLSRGCPRNWDFALSAARRGAGASKSLTSLNFGAARTRSNCWTPTCWPARTMRHCWNSLPPAGRWWTSPRDWTSG